MSSVSDLFWAANVPCYPRQTGNVVHFEDYGAKRGSGGIVFWGILRASYDNDDS
jgi:hypothetical protein